MRNTKTKKLTAFVLALIMLIGSAVPAFAADANTDAETTENALQEISGYTMISYESYKTKYNYSTTHHSVTEEDEQLQEVVIDALDYIKDPEVTDAIVKEIEIEDKKCLEIGELTEEGVQGSASWSFDIPKAGWYSVEFLYTANTTATTDIERIILINGKAPYAEARYQKFNKVWEYQYENKDKNERDGVFALDITGNELRPETTLKQEWTAYSLQDKNGYYTVPLEFYLEEGENTITLQGVRDTICLNQIRFYQYEALRSYEDVLAEYEKKGYKPADAEVIKFQAETPDAVSNYTIYPVYDRSSAITEPQDESIVYRNTMGGDKWVTNGQWIRYSFKCEKSGLYEIAMRFSQDQLKGMYTSRALRINGEYPFEEAKNCQFPYDNKWQTQCLSDNNGAFQFYFEKGKTYEIELEVNLGSLSDVARQVASVVESLNEDYMSIVELTGASPDEYRDYGFTRVMPEVIADLGIQGSILQQLVEYISEINGIKSDNTSTLEQASLLIEKMASDEKEIAANLTSLKEWVSSLGTWLSDISTQFLELDYILVQPVGTELPKGEGNGWKSFWFEIQKFIASFYTEYDAVSAEEEATSENAAIEVWTSAGRDQAQIIKNLVNNGYTKETDIPANIKLVAGGTLLPAILSGVGPDVSIDATNPIDMAIRGAVLPLNGYEGYELNDNYTVSGYDEVMARFAESAKVPLTLYGTTYAVPVTQSFSVMFVRNDVLEELNMEVPQTWDELMSLVPVLQFNNMEIGMIQDFTTMLYQDGGAYWKNEGMAINFDDYKSLDAFEYMCNMFTQYSLPIAYDAQNRFKTGEVPIVIQDYSFYNTLVVFAPEISGLWSFYQIPGTLNEETGEIDRTILSSSSGIMLPRGCSDPETAWTFVDWYSAKDFQVDYSDEMMALLGPSAKQPVANLDAIKELPWSSKEAEVLRECFDHTDAVVPYPGNYYVGRYTGFAFNAAYNEGADPSDELLSHVSAINKEITRKRKEFELMLMEEWEAINAFLEFDNYKKWKKECADWDELKDVDEDELEAAFEKMDNFEKWKEYWADERGLKDADENTTYIQDNQGDADEYTYVDWMKDNKVTVASHEDWLKAVSEDGETCTYKEWVKK